MHRAGIACKTDKIVNKHLMLMILAILLLTITTIFAWRTTTVNAAAASITVEEINYEDSTITLKANGSDSKIYFSDSKQKTWEVIPGEIGLDRRITMDISWIPVSSKYTIKFKGDASTNVISVNIPKQISSFRATYNRVKGTLTYSNQGSRQVQWRKKDSYLWTDVNSSTIGQELGYLSTQGATVYLRLAAINGRTSNGVLDTGERPSKEIVITIPKKLSAPVITINGSKFYIPVSKNMAYRIVSSNGTTTEWTTVNSASNLMLSNIAPTVLYTDGSTTQREVTLQFKSNPSSSSQVSHITTVTVPIQDGAPGLIESGISISYTSSSSLALTIKAASTTKPYEYTIVKAGETLDYQRATWTSITSSSSISINKTKAPKGSQIYVRKASIPASANVKFSLASKEVEVVGSLGVLYPETTAVTDLTTLITTAGVCNVDNTDGYLTFTLYSSTKTTVSSITFKDQYGNTKGTVSSKSTVALNTNSTSAANQYIITTQITSTSNIDSVTEAKLYADIILSNEDTVTSNTTTGLMLYIYPKTVVNNKENSSYTNAFQRILYSNDSKDAKSFTFQLDFGKEDVMDSNTIGLSKNDKVMIKSMTFGSYQLKDTSDYQVVYSSYTDAQGDSIRTAKVTVNVGEFERQAGVTATSGATALQVKLNNGEVLNNQITIKLVETATLVNGPTAWSISERSLKETTQSTVKNPDNTTTTVETEVVTFEIPLTIFSNSYAVGVSDVTWDGKSILKSAEISDGKAVIYLSNAKINKLETESTSTHNLIISLSNGYTITSGYKLTIINAD